LIISGATYGKGFEYFKEDTSAQMKSSEFLVFDHSQYRPLSLFFFEK